MIQIFAKLAAAGDVDAGHKLYRLVAARIRARLSPEEAAVVAAWFDRLGAGEDPLNVFPVKKTGRPRKTGLSDDYDIANIVRQHLDAKILKASEIYAKVGKAHGLKPRTVANIYSKLKNEI